MQLNTISLQRIIYALIKKKKAKKVILFTDMAMVTGKSLHALALWCRFILTISGKTSCAICPPGTSLYIGKRSKKLMFCSNGNSFGYVVCWCFEICSNIKTKFLFNLRLSKLLLGGCQWKKNQNDRPGWFNFVLFIYLYLFIFQRFLLCIFFSLLLYYI